MPSITWIVSRHRGALEFLAQSGFVGRECAHLNVDDVKPNDIVIGTLPMPMVAKLCTRGVHYWHLSVPLTPADRGRELSVQRLRALGVRVERFEVRRLTHDGE